MKLHWLLPGILGLWLLSSPVYAASLQNWRFDSRSNRLEFTTDTNVQPQAKLITGPTRLVIDLPGIQLGRQLRQQLVNTPGIAQVRTGQFNSNTTRLVIELKPGYTIDPNQVKFQGISPRRWVVQIPNPQRQQTPVTPPPTSPSPVTPPPTSTAASTIQGLRVTRDGFYLRVDGEKPEAKSFKRSSNQRQITIDFNDVTLAPDLHQKSLAINSRGVRHIQLSQLPNSVVRVTMDVTDGSPDWQGLTNRFGVVIIPVSGSRGLSNQSTQQPWPVNQEIASTGGQWSPSPSPGQPPSTVPPIAINVPPAANPAPPPPRTNPAPPPRTNPRPPTPRPPSNSRIRVAIDAGHGGRDPGAVANGLLEKEIVLDISKQVAAILEQNGVQAVLLRRDDREIDLAPRVDMAERANATLFVSIHANAISVSRPEVNGLETYYYETGRGLARDIHSSILQTLSIRDRGIRRARFYVLRQTSMPSVLVETGFVTGREDSAKLRTAVFRRQMARGIANGILRHVQQNY